jgi:hypothetical protein
VLSVFDYVFLGRELPGGRSVASLVLLLASCAGYTYYDHGFRLQAYGWLCVWYVFFLFEACYVKYTCDTVAMVRACVAADAAAGAVDVARRPPASPVCAPGCLGAVWPTTLHTGTHTSSTPTTHTHTYTQHTHAQAHTHTHTHTHTHAHTAPSDQLGPRVLHKLPVGARAARRVSRLRRRARAAAAAQL